MRQNQFSSALGSEFTRLGVQGFEASHRLAGLRRHLEALAAVPPLSDGLGTLPAAPLLLALAAFMLLVM